MALPNEVLEHESDEELRRVVDRHCGRDERHAVERAHPRARTAKGGTCLHLWRVY